MTRRVAIIGHPVAHSRSPLIHGYWLRQLGIDGDYVARDVAPEAIDGFLADFSASGLAGGNVTVPHKEAAFRACVVREPVADALGAVNTLWLEGGRLHGANTDVHGFLANLDTAEPEWARALGEAVVLGAGGAARAVVFGLMQRGVDRVVVANRTLARAEALRDQFGPRVLPIDWRDLGGRLNGCRLLINTTSLGMKGQPPLDIDLSALSPDALVTDIVYVPLETPLLKAARARGLATVDGLGMLLHQAVPGFERWFGVRPVVTAALRALVIADLKARGQFA
ncbi:shikimate dehydrogenase [Ancylobacter dichloromethanicus]|uniref:Shikimate dehydrogenase (NADP(+)) n=1 Tax=Ancylobacter dichloromethanicus TaxID=518825 RepID=A0A9W6JBE9_9HYPH|nr:shikimate dehydrogenase [Ancylobacter dichloromethanicus]MBS7554917.1 shikimate dehydrogenase [Ancylobacter dichloromethanicus]GLK73311.1 shikimate dehydrogenase (NADP(+)) [Ancylobacter dichloromethanicus]